MLYNFQTSINKKTFGSREEILINPKSGKEEDETEKEGGRKKGGSEGRKKNLLKFRKVFLRQ